MRNLPPFTYVLRGTEIQESAAARVTNGVFPKEAARGEASFRNKFIKPPEVKLPEGSRQR